MTAQTLIRGRWECRLPEVENIVLGETATARFLKAQKELESLQAFHDLEPLALIEAACDRQSEKKFAYVSAGGRRLFRAALFKHHLNKFEGIHTFSCGLPGNSDGAFLFLLHDYGFSDALHVSVHIGGADLSKVQWVLGKFDKMQFSDCGLFPFFSFSLVDFRVVDLCREMVAAEKTALANAAGIRQKIYERLLNGVLE